MKTRRAKALWIVLAASATGSAVLPAAAQASAPAARVLSAGQPGKEAPASREVDLRPKFTKGDLTRFVMTIESVGQTSDPEAAQPARKSTSKPVSKPGGKPTRDDARNPARSSTPGASTADEQTMTQELGLLLRVRDTDPEGGATVELVYESVKLALKTPDMDVQFDSTKKKAGPGAKKPGTSPGRTRAPATPDDADGPAGGLSMPSEEDMVEAMMRPMVGATIVMKIDHEGNVLSTSGGSGLSPAAMLQAMGQAGSIGGISGGGDAAALGSLFSIAKGKGSAAVGESWTTNDTMQGSVIGDFRITNKTVLKSASRGLAELAFNGQLTPGSQGAPGMLAGMAQVQESTFSGQATWDTERGMLKAMTSQQRVVLDATVPDTEEGQKTVRLSSRTNVNVRRVD